MRDRISRTAAWGSFETGGKIVSSQTKASLVTILEKIRSGQFAGEWMAEAESDEKNLEKLIDGEAKHPIEKAGRRMRSLMPYLSEDE